MSVTLPFPEIIARLLVAALVGGAVGLNRELRHKAAGLRTFGLVSLGAATAALVVSADGATIDTASRVLQGVVTGIGFLGAGVIMRPSTDNRIVGLTTAASIWLVAAVGFASGLGQWPVALVSGVLALGVLVGGAYVERAIRQRSAPPPDH